MFGKVSDSHSQWVLRILLSHTHYGTEQLEGAYCFRHKYDGLGNFGLSMSQCSGFVKDDGLDLKKGITIKAGY